MTDQQTTATPSEVSRYDQIIRKYAELTELLTSLGYGLSADDTDLDVTLEGGEFLFTLDTLERSNY